MLSLEYAAGFFDGEGCVTVSANSEDRHIFVKVLVCNTERPVIESFHTQFGGSFYIRKPCKKGHKTQYIWQAVGDDAKQFIDRVRPYSIIKRQQLDLACQFFEHRSLPREVRHELRENANGNGGRVWQRRPETIQFEVNIKRQMNELNFRSSTRATQKNQADARSAELLAQGLV